MTPKRGDFPLEVLKDLPPLPAPSPLPEPMLPPEEPADEVSLREYLDVLVEARWLVVAATAIAVAIGAAYAILATPIYRSDALVQVEDKKNGGGVLGDIADAFSASTPAETEIEILRSRSLIGEVVRELRLDVVAAPRRFPIVGGAIARRWQGVDPAPARIGLRSYAWGGERISVNDLDVPASLHGEDLTLVAGEGGRWTLRAPDGAVLVEGEVGKPASRGEVRAFVSELLARPGTKFQVNVNSPDETIEDLQEALRVAEKGKKTGIIRVALDGASPERIAATLDALSRAYVRQNVERKSAEAEKTLEFLQSQLPAVRAQLQTAEAELERYRARNGSLDVGAEGQAAITRAVDIEKGISELKIEHAALRQKFTADHPALVALAQKLRRLEGDRAALEARVRRMPEAELQSTRRLRDVKVANELYVTLLNRAEELKVVKEGTIGNVRVLDTALMPTKPVSPRKLPIVALSLVLGLAAGVGAGFARRALDQGVEDPDAVERALGIGVHASVPQSDSHAEAERRARRDRRAVPLLAADNPKDIAVESLRSLRTSLQFALVEARNGVVAVSGPAPGVGKSFVTANLAHLLGEAGKHVLVVDADMRRGRLHTYYGTDRGRGLSDVIGGETSLDEAVRMTRSPNVRFLPSGTIPPNPAELLGSERFQRVLADLASRHEVVLIDTPPILAVTDAALVGRIAGVTLLVIRAGAHPVREISTAVRLLARNGVRVQGIVMNGVRLDRGLGRRNAYHYQYKYE
jgi:tyrosine-protein kinase Etk/Wzc